MAAMTRITAPEGDVINGPASLGDPDAPWFVDGVAYTDSGAWIVYFTKRDYDLTVAAAPGTYTDAVAAMKNQAARTSVHGTTVQDAADPNRPTYF